MKKKMLALVLSTAMTLSLAACGGKPAETPTADGDGKDFGGAELVETIERAWDH